MRLLLVLTLPFFFLMPSAAADETHADCEEEQWWIGYRTTRLATETMENETAGTGAEAIACEGEQWDGQDSVAPEAEGSCTGAFRPEPAHANLCLGPDPNFAAGEDPLQPVGARASAGEGEAYAAANVALVGRVAVYGGTCGASEAGLEGAAECSGTREARGGVYVRDNTPGNALVAITCFRPTGCGFSDADCSQETYHRGAKDGYPYCQRDNTAVGVGAVLP